MVGLIIIIVVVVILVLIAISTYNGLVRIRTRVDDAWAQIDVQLKRRHDLIPNLIETVKGYAAHERETLDSVVQARNQAVSANTPEQSGQAENVLTQTLGRLFALAENYPNLKANQNFLELQEELTATEDKVAYARQFYNDSVQSYNARIATIPAKFFAGPMGYKAREYFQIDTPEDREVPKVQFYDLYEDIAQNKRRTWLLIAIFSIVVFGIAWLITYLLSFGIAGVVIAAVIAIVSSVVSYYNSDKVALAMSHAKPAPEADYKRLHNLVEGLCIGAGIPKPRLYVVDDPSPNAFSTGRNPQHSAVAVTTGLLEKMNRVELEGVLAHELSHIRNYDILVSTLAVTMVGMVALMSDLFLRFTFWGGMSDRDDSNDNPLGIVLVVFGFIAIIFAPLIAQLMQLAISRQREYLADVSGVQITRYPPGLISALEKLKDDDTHVHSASKATAHMWIEEPLDDDKHKKRKFDEMFMTHPPLEDRIARLEEM